MEGRAKEWWQSGSHFEWTPPPEQPSQSSDPIRIFHAELGDPDSPLVVLLHGFPTSSIDWSDVAPLLADRFRLGMLDFPGFGFSEKPKRGPYTIRRDAALVAHYVGEVLGAVSSAVVAHDRGDSVALALVELAGRAASGFELTSLVLSNGNVFLPLSNLTTFQRLLLDPATAPSVLEVLTPEMLAAGMGTTTFTPPRTMDNPSIAALAETFAFDDGLAVLHDTIQYLVERSENEAKWLELLAGSPVPTTVVWGLHDTVAPLRVATHVWDRYLSSKPGDNTFWLLPRANHYLQNDQPAELAEVIRSAMAASGGDSPAPAGPGALSAAEGAPVLLDRSRAVMPSAAEVLRSPAG